MAERPYIVGNWKMNGTRAMLSEARAIDRAAQRYMKVEVALAPPFTLIHAVHREAEQIGVGAQDCHAKPKGAFTGDISASMIKEVGATYVILGHSERRADHHETSEDVRAKAKAAQAAGLMTVICLGESLLQREATNTLDIIGAQLSLSVPDGATGENLVVAYEPIWAIGSGLTPTPDQIGEVHDFMRTRLERRFGAGVGRSVRLLYGGSVKPENAAEIFAISNVDGALVGGASLSAKDFSPIISALEAS